MAAKKATGKKGPAKGKANKQVTKNQNLPVSAPPQSSRGMEDVGTEDLAIPRLKLLQDMSAEVKKRDERYVEGAEVGMYCNSVTNELFEAVTVIPVKYYRKWLVWSSDESDATLVGVFDSAPEADAIAAKDEEYVCMFTPTYIVLYIDAQGEAQEASLPMPSTKIKKAKAWNSMMRMARCDMFAKSYELTAVGEKNAKGDYFNVQITANEGFLAGDDPLYLQAEELYEALMSGERKVGEQSFSEQDIDKNGQSQDADDSDGMF